MQRLGCRSCKCFVISWLVRFPLMSPGARRRGVGRSVVRPGSTSAEGFVFIPREKAIGPSAMLEEIALRGVDLDI